MKKQILLSIVATVFLMTSFSFSSVAEAQAKKNTTKSKAQAQAKTAPKSSIVAAVNQIKGGQYVSAANNLLALSRRPELEKDRSQVKFLLGLSLIELNLNQVAAFQFVDVIKMGDPRFVSKALEKLLIVTDKLGDETLLNYAIQRIDINSFPKQNQELLYYRLGEIKQKAGLFSEAAQNYSKVGSKSRYYFNALYNMGLSQAEAGQVGMAIDTFKKLLSARDKADINDTNKVAAQMALARLYYQRQEWDKSIDAYSMIPRDNLMWHDAIFEQSWAMLRAARFRSALSNFQTLHSSYYDEFYIPESLLLRSIVYLYICKYDEMDKVLALFEKQYGGAHRDIQKFLKANLKAEAYYTEVERAFAYRFERKSKVRGRLPYVVTRFLTNEGDVRRSLLYVSKIAKEKKQVEEDARIRNLPIGAYSIKLLNNRIKSSKEKTGDIVKAHLQNMSTELTDLKEQASLIKYEMINGQKEAIKKRITEKDVDKTDSTQEKDRSFYAQNGYEYYPFQGEFWLDEVGNYHYLGKQSCE